MPPEYIISDGLILSIYEYRSNNDFDQDTNVYIYHKTGIGLSGISVIINEQYYHMPLAGHLKYYKLPQAIQKLFDEYGHIVFYDENSIDVVLKLLS